MPMREAVAVFGSEDALEQLIEDLESHGIDHAETNPLTAEETVDENALMTDVDQPEITVSLYV
jgi:hypothetical protein